MKNPQRYSSLIFYRNNFRNGLTVLVNGSLHPSKSLRPHVAEEAAANVEEYAQQLEKLISEFLIIAKTDNEVMH